MFSLPWFQIFTLFHQTGKYKGSVVIAQPYHMFYMPFYSQTAASLSEDDVWGRFLLHRNTKNVSRVVLLPCKGNKTIFSLCPGFAFTISLWILAYSRVYISLYCISLYIHNFFSRRGRQQVEAQTATVLVTVLA